MDIFAVEAYTASWIEMHPGAPFIITSSSKPIRLRGLKCKIHFVNFGEGNVEAYTASWIEIESIIRQRVCVTVEAYTASWIEMKHLEM